MNMGTSSTTTIAATVATSIVNLTLGDPRCNSDSCLAFKVAHAASQAEVSYYYQFEYGKWISYYYVIILSFFVVAYINRLWSYRKNAVASTVVTTADKALALFRSFTYRRIPGAVGVYLGLPSFGLLALATTSLAVILAFSFAIHPYYRLYRGFGSPPLAIRAGLMSVALTPLIFALAGKYNLVTLATGYSHEKLNVIHRYVSYGCLILAIIHTVPYLISDGDGPTYFGLAGLHQRWYAAGSYEFTGTPPLGILVFLSFFSIPYFRHCLYELFKYSHYAAAITYLGLMFWHCGNEGNSWYYLYATVAIFVLSILGRLFFKTSSVLGYHWFDKNLATIQPLSRSMLRVKVFAQAGQSWSPSQHVFLRFPTISALANHPFTIASLYSETHQFQPQDMSFLIRPYAGFTAILHSMAVASPSSELSLPVDVSGPYGGLDRALEKRYNTVILVAGGGGISSVLPWLICLAGKMAAGNEACVTSQVVLIWAVKDIDALEWVREQLEDALGTAPERTISINLFVTDNTESAVDLPSTESTDANVEKQAHFKVGMKEETATRWTINRGRPDLRKEIHSLLGESRSVVLGCGPENMKIDVSNTVASAQSKVVRGEVKEVALYTESFGW